MPRTDPDAAEEIRLARAEWPRESGFDEEMLQAMQEEMASGGGGGDNVNPLEDQMIQAMVSGHRGSMSTTHLVAET